MKKPAKRSSRFKQKPSGIKDPAHPFHSFAPKDKPGIKKTENSFAAGNPLTPKGKYAGKRFEGRHPAPVNTSANKTGATSDPFPLNKFIAHTGLCARRKAVEYIRAGEVTVNEEVINEPGFKVTEKDVVKLKGKRLFLQKEPVYILLNKPKGYITTTDDPQERKTVMELIARATRERVYPVGRLDRNTSGLLLLTNDGALAQLLAHPGYNMKKVYHVVLNKALTKHDFEKITTGITLEDGVVRIDALAYADQDDRKQIGLEIHSGRNRIVRRIFESLGYEIMALDRVTYAGLTKKNIPRGKWRMLTPREVITLKHFNKGKGNKEQGMRNKK
jgi:23S rRNA pseudouridine2605 synthase